MSVVQTDKKILQTVSFLSVPLLSLGNQCSGFSTSPSKHNSTFYKRTNSWLSLFGYCFLFNLTGLSPLRGAPCSLGFLPRVHQPVQNLSSFFSRLKSDILLISILVYVYICDIQSLPLLDLGVWTSITTSKRYQNLVQRQDTPGDYGLWSSSGTWIVNRFYTLREVQTSSVPHPSFSQSTQPLKGSNVLLYGTQGRQVRSEVLDT